VSCHSRSPLPTLLPRPNVLQPFRDSASSRLGLPPSYHPLFRRPRASNSSRNSRWGAKLSDRVLGRKSAAFINARRPVRYIRIRIPFESPGEIRLKSAKFRERDDFESCADPRASARATRQLPFIVLSASMVVRNVSKLRPRTVETFAISLGREDLLSLSLSRSLALTGFHSRARLCSRGIACRENTTDGFPIRFSPRCETNLPLFRK